MENNLLNGILGVPATSSVTGHQWRFLQYLAATTAQSQQSSTAAVADQPMVNPLLEFLAQTAPTNSNSVKLVMSNTGSVDLFQGQSSLTALTDQPTNLPTYQDTKLPSYQLTTLTPCQYSNLPTYPPREEECTFPQDNVSSDALQLSIDGDGDSHVPSNDSDSFTQDAPTIQENNGEVSSIGGLSQDVVAENVTIGPSAPYNDPATGIQLCTSGEAQETCQCHGGHVPCSGLVHYYNSIVNANVPMDEATLYWKLRYTHKLAGTVPIRGEPKFKLIYVNDRAYFACDLCPRLSKSIRSRIAHASVHKGETMCQICSTYFSRVDVLRSHTLRYHPDPIDHNY